MKLQQRAVIRENELLDRLARTQIAAAFNREATAVGHFHQNQLRVNFARDDSGTAFRQFFKRVIEERFLDPGEVPRRHQQQPADLPLVESVAERRDVFEIVAQRRDRQFRNRRRVAQPPRCRNQVAWLESPVNHEVQRLPFLWQSQNVLDRVLFVSSVDQTSASRPPSMQQVRRDLATGLDLTAHQRHAARRADVGARQRPHSQPPLVDFQHRLEVRLEALLGLVAEVVLLRRA